MEFSAGIIGRLYENKPKHLDHPSGTCHFGKAQFGKINLVQT
jgi:hypothetical protein